MDLGATNLMSVKTQKFYPEQRKLLPGSFGLTDVTALKEPYLSSTYLCSGTDKGGPVGSLSALATDSL